MLIDSALVSIYNGEHTIGLFFRYRGLLMISTVTTSTVSILTTPAIAGSMALIAVLILFALLLQKEVATASEDSRLRQLSRLLNFSLVPLLLTFILIVVYKVAEVLN